MPNFLKYSILIGLLLCSPAMLLARGFDKQVTGVTKLLQLEINDSTTITVRTTEGLTKIRLTRQHRNVPNGKVISATGEKQIPAPALKLYQGRVLFKKNRNQQLTAASASFYAGVLRINFAGNRKRHFMIEVRPERDPNLGRQTSFPASLLELCGVHDQLPRKNYSSSATLPIFRASRATQPTLLLGMDADYEFYQANSSSSSNSLAALESIVNSIDSIYSDQLGVRIALNDYNIYTTSSQPYTSTNTSTLLEQFTEYLNDNPAHLTGGLRHLMTGKDTSYQGNSSVAGLAWLGVVCSSTSLNTGLSERLHSSVQHLVVAHELGHNFGANHDNTASNSIMYPSVGPGQSNFSSRSLNEINSHLAGNDSCLDNDAPDNNNPDTPSVTLRAKLTRTNVFKFVLVPEALALNDCSIEIYGATSSANLNSSPTLIVSRAGSGTTGRRQKISFRPANRTPNRSLYFRANLSCASDYQSNTRTLRAGGGTGLRSVRASNFLNYLVSKFG